MDKVTGGIAAGDDLARFHGAGARQARRSQMSRGRAAIVIASRPTAAGQSEGSWLTELLTGGGERRTTRPSRKDRLQARRETGSRRPAVDTMQTRRSSSAPAHRLSGNNHPRYAGNPESHAAARGSGSMHPLAGAVSGDATPGVKAGLTDERGATGFRGNERAQFCAGAFTTSAPGSVIWSAGPTTTNVSARRIEQRAWRARCVSAMVTAAISFCRRVT